MKRRKRKEAAPRMFFGDDGRPEARKAQSLGAKYGKLLEQHEKNAAKLRRAFRAWEKTTAQLRRAEKKLDQLQLTRDTEATA